jgi:protein-disulfide isomerase
VLDVVRSLRPVLLALTLTTLGCHAQVPAGSQANGSASAQDRLSPELARRVEVLIRTRSNVPPNYTIQVGPRTRSDVPGFSEVSVSFIAEGKASKPVSFLLSEDGKTLAQFSKYDISADPRALISAEGRPARGGPADAPVLIVGFDDLECPFCSKMHAQLFPALLQRYKDQVRIVYRDFPLSQHPWATRAAIDVNCVGAQSTPGYWNLVDYIHEHAGDLGGQEKSLAKANTTLDTLAREEGTRQKVNAGTLDACLTKQDDASVKASIKQGETLGVDSTPALFINGEKLEGAYPLEDVYRMIDNALLAQGKTPPPPVAAPPVPPPSTPIGSASPAPKPGN